MKPVTIFAAVVFFIISVAHLIRVILQVPVVVGTITIPLWPSIVAFVILLILGIMLLREGKK
jgi:putative Mn2+ efflux pump MntP